MADNNKQSVAPVERKTTAAAERQRELKPWESDNEVLEPRFWLARDEKGIARWYDSDPFHKSEDELKASSVCLEPILLDYFGEATTHNPLKVTIVCKVIRRGEIFNSLDVTREYLKENKRHLEDVSGNRVEVLDINNPDSAYPINAVVFDKKGVVLCTRKYSNDGKCSDGDRKNTLIVIHDGCETDVNIKLPGKVLRKQ